MSTTQPLQDDEVAPLVARLPPDVRKRLARGPVADGSGGIRELADTSPLECRCCQALNWDGLSEETQGILRAGGHRALSKLSYYHNGPDLFLDSFRTIPRPGAGPESYRRCLLIYRAAGWSPTRRADKLWLSRPRLMTFYVRAKGLLSMGPVSTIREFRYLFADRRAAD